MSQVDKNYNNKIRFYAILKKASKAFLFLFGAMFVIGFIVFVASRLNADYYIPGKGCITIYPDVITKCMEEKFVLWRLFYQANISTITIGLLGISVSTPVILIINKRITFMQSSNKERTYLDNKQFEYFQRESNKTIIPPKYN
jgi:hypothetical protein